MFSFAVNYLTRAKYYEWTKTKWKKKKIEKGKEIISVFFFNFPFVFQFFVIFFLFFFFCRKFFLWKQQICSRHFCTPCVYCCCRCFCCLYELCYHCCWCCLANQSTIQATRYQWRIVCCLVLRIAFFFKRYLHCL